MADVDKILQLVADGALTPEDADQILAALNAEHDDELRPQPATGPWSSASPRHLRVEVTDHGQRVINLRVPVNIAGWASTFLPGLSEQDSDRIRSAIASGTRGTILDIGDEDGRVLIVSE